jgi:hypothetical protein
VRACVVVKTVTEAFHRFVPFPFESPELNMSSLQSRYRP